MKKLVMTLLCLMPVTALADNPLGMSDAEMQDMMQQMQKAQVCMEKIDQSELDALEKKANQYEIDMKSLCAKGKREEAQQMAMAYMKDIYDNQAVKDAKRCAEMMKGVMQSMPFIYQDKDYSSQHVCDSY